MTKPTTPARRSPRKSAARQMQGQPQTRGLDLSALFGAAGQALADNQGTLNQADLQNGNHGDNMVQIFNMISQTMAQDQGASPSQQLNHASQYVAQHANSGSAQVYSQGLAQAAQQLHGQAVVTPSNAGTLITALLGGGAQPAGGGAADLIGSLLTGASQPSASNQPAGGDMADLLGGLLGAGMSEQAPAAGQAAGGGMADLLGGLLGGGAQQAQPQAQDNGIDIGDVLNAGMAFMNAKQQGQNNLQAALTALMAAGPMGQSSHRQQSGQLVAGALMQAVAAMSKRQ